MENSDGFSEAANAAMVRMFANVEEVVGANHVASVIDG